MSSFAKTCISILYVVVLLCIGAFYLHALPSHFDIEVPRVYNRLKLQYRFVPSDILTRTALPRHMTVSFYTDEQLVSEYFLELRKGEHDLYWPLEVNGTTITQLRLKFAEAFENYYPARYWQTEAQRKSIEEEKGKIGLFINVRQTKDDSIVPALPLNLMTYENEGRERDFSHYRWQSYPDIHVFIFKNNGLQNQYFLRLAYFIEKEGYAGSILVDEQLAGKKGWNAHDYKFEDIARFFESAQKQGVQLNRQELVLQRYLDEKGLLSEASGACCIASIHANLAAELRDVLLDHEIAHMLYFRDENLAAAMQELWAGLDQEFKAVWRSFLSTASYDAENTYLVVNELFGYLMQRPIEALSWYAPYRFFGYSEVSEPLTAQSIAIASRIERYIYQKYGLFSGQFLYIRPLHY